MTEDEKRRVKSDVIEAMRIAIEDSLSPVAHVPGNMAIAYKAAEAGYAAGIEALAGPPEPSEDEVAKVIGPLRLCSCESCLERTTETARAVLALFRSRING